MIRFDRTTIDRGGQIVVEDLSLQVPAGRTTALIGRSGAGRSSLLAAAATAMPVHSGDILIAGASVRREPHAARRSLGYAPSQLPAWPGIRAGEFLELFAVSAGLGGRDLRTALERALAMAGLAGRGDTPLDSLSDGHAKLLLLARALLHDPQVLIWDDPFGGLDPRQRREIERLIGDAHLMGRTVLAAIDAADVPGCFTHLAVLTEGRLVAEGAADPAAFEPRSWTHRIRCPAHAEAAADLLSAHAAEAIDADTVEIRNDSAAGPFAAVVAALVRAGFPVEAAGFHPAWPAQLV